MIDILDLDKSSNIQLDLEIFGDADGSTPCVRLIIFDNSGTNLCFVAKRTGDGTYVFTIPKMEGKLSSGTYDVEVEVILGSKYFVPVKDQLKFKAETKPVVTLKKTEEKQKPQSDVTVSMKKLEVTDTKKLQEAVANIPAKKLATAVIM